MFPVRGAHVRSNPVPGRRPGPAAGQGGQLLVGFVPELLPGFAPLDLLLEVIEDLEPDGFQRAATRVGVNVRARHGQLHKRAKGRRSVPLLFQHDLGGADGNQVVQAFEVLFEPGAEAGGGVEAANSELDIHVWFWWVRRVDQVL